MPVVPVFQPFGHRIEAICARCPFFLALWAQNRGFLCPESLFSGPLGTKLGLFVSGVPVSWSFGHRIEAICARCPCFPALWAQNRGYLCPLSLFSSPLGTKPGLFVSGVTFFRPFGHKTGAFRVRSPCFPTLWAQNRCFSCSEHRQIRNSGAKQALFAPDRRYLCISGAKTPQFAPEKHLPLRL